MKRLEVIAKYGSTSIVTYTGRVIDLLNPKPDDIAIEDIAIGLSREFRFANQTRYAYTVAQHSYIVASLVPHELALQALLHDATEAYIKDIPSPLKGLMQSYKEIEERLHKVVCARFKISSNLEKIKSADMTALDFEWEMLFEVKDPKFCWHPEDACQRFMARFKSIVEFDNYHFHGKNS